MQYLLLQSEGKILNRGNHFLNLGGTDVIHMKTASAHNSYTVLFGCFFRQYTAYNIIFMPGDIHHRRCCAGRFVPSQ